MEQNLNFACVFLLLLITIVSSQETWMSDSCKCEKNAPAGTIAKLQPQTTWSACEDWTEEDSLDIGCYSGRQKRTLNCTYVNVDGTIASDLRQLNNKQANCEQFRRCHTPGRRCEGYWGQWEFVGLDCDCDKGGKIQSRYCNKDLPSGVTINSKHCTGSDGYSEQIRTIPCTKECPSSSTIKPSKKSVKKTFATKTSKTTQKLTETTKTTTVATTENTTQEVLSSTETTQSGANVDIIIVAVSAAAVAFFAALMLLIMCCMRKNKPKEEMKNNNYDRPSSYIPPPHDITYMRNISTQRAAVRNSLYIPYDENGEEQNSPPPGYSTQPSSGRKSVLERQIQNRRGLIVPLSQRDRSQTVGMVYQGYDTTMRDYRPNYDRIPRAQTFREPAYQQPRDSLHNNEIYCTIDEVRPTGMLHGSQPNISSRQYRNSDSVFDN